jgi:carbon-monoxide dehydrogenase small subunit
MNRVTLTVNGAEVTADVAPRTHLADFLREDRLLTGTHIGCEHGVCGACTLLIDGAPARSCIAFAAACDGCDVRTIEGLEDDPIVVRLREAFTAEHALQCGYCTPGMLVTARDIVLRLPHADEARIRLELAGNLCRCTGYAGIVHAIIRVLAEPVILERPKPAVLPPLVVTARRSRAAMPPQPEVPGLTHSVRISLPLARVWSAIQNVQLVADCVPGARLLSVEGDQLRGEMRASLGPIETLFSGEGQVAFDATEHRAEVSGDGRDSRSGTRLSGRAVVRLHEVDAATTRAEATIDYTMRGPLAQFARGALVQEFAAAIATTFAANLQARLTGGVAPVSARLSVGTLMLRAIWRRVRAILGLD